MNRPKEIRHRHKRCDIEPADNQPLDEFGNEIEYWCAYKITHKDRGELLDMMEAARTAFSDYKRSEGCSCCQDDEPHEAADRLLGELLDIDRYDDDSGLDYWKYSTDGELDD